MEEKVTFLTNKAIEQSIHTYWRSDSAFRDCVLLVLEFKVFRTALGLGQLTIQIVIMI